MDRDVYNSYGSDVNKKSFTFRFDGHIESDVFSIMIMPKDNMCVPCCIASAQRAVELWADGEGVDLLHDDQSQLRCDSYDLVDKLRADFKDDTKMLVGVIVLGALLGFVFGLVSILFQRV